jgi:hypothetical protein
MKVLIATRRTQGAVPGDYCWALEGELVTAVAPPCASPDRCGCERGFPGLGSSKATTTALVVDRDELQPHQLRLAVQDSLERQGWLRNLPPAQADELVDEHVRVIVMVCAHFEVGAVVGRRASSVFIRALTTV